MAFSTVFTEFQANLETLSEKEDEEEECGTNSQETQAQLPMLNDESLKSIQNGDDVTRTSQNQLRSKRVSIGPTTTRVSEQRDDVTPSTSSKGRNYILKAITPSIGSSTHKITRAKTWINLKEYIHVHVVKSRTFDNIESAKDAQVHSV